MTASFPTRRIGALDVAVTDQAGAVAAIISAVEDRAPRIFGFCNAHSVNMARARPDFAAAASRICLFNDGIGVDIAGRILYGTRFPDNLNGTDLTPAVLAALPPGTGIFLLGSPPGVAARAGEILSARYPNIRLTGAEHGFLIPAGEAAVAARIRKSGAQLVLVGMGHPHQELWAARHVTETGAVLMCIGAFLDFAAGAVVRAPNWVRRARAEWAWRLIMEPRRMAGRYLVGNFTFLIGVARQRLSGSRA